MISFFLNTNVFYVQHKIFFFPHQTSKCPKITRLITTKSSVVILSRVIQIKKPGDTKSLVIQIKKKTKFAMPFILRFFSLKKFQRCGKKMLSEFKKRTL